MSACVLPVHQSTPMQVQILPPFLNPCNKDLQISGAKILPRTSELIQQLTDANINIIY